MLKERELNNTEGPNIDKMANKLLRSVEGGDALTTAQRSEFVELVGQFVSNFEGEFRPDWFVDIFNMMATANREGLCGLIETLKECARAGGYYHGAESGFTGILDYVNMNRSPYGLPPIDEAQRAKLKDLVERACEASGGRISTNWWLGFTFIIPWPFPNDDVYPEVIKVLKHFAIHGGLQGEYPRDIQTAYQGPPPSKDEKLQDMKIARSIEELLKERPYMLTDDVKKLLGIKTNKTVYKRVRQTLRLNTALSKRLNAEMVRKGNYNELQLRSLGFTNELRRLVISGTDPVAAFVWMSISDNLRDSIPDEWFVLLDPMGMDEEMLRWFNLKVEDSRSAEYVITRWGKLITNELSRFVGNPVELEIWDNNSTPWALRYVVA